MAETIEEMLASMLTFGKDTKVDRLYNNHETWRRIGAKDSFRELGFSSVSEKEAFLKEWIEENPYRNI